MASTAELESRYLAGQRASSTLAATGGAPTGNQSNGVVFATGSDTPRTLADWMAQIATGSFEGLVIDGDVAKFKIDPDTGYMGFGRLNPGYWMDFNKEYADVAPGSAGHFFHMYGTQTQSSLTATGQTTGFYAHLDGDNTIGIGDTAESIYPLRGNGTWGPPGTLTTLAGVYAGARVLNNAVGSLAGNGVITNGYGGFFEAGNETTGTGTTTNAYGVYAQARNTDGGVIDVATGVYSYVRNQTDGGGITIGYGFRANLEDVGAGVATFYGYHSANPAKTNHWANYHSGTARNYFRGDLVVGVATDYNAPIVAYDATGNRPMGYFYSALAAGYTNTVFRSISAMSPGSGFKLFSGTTTGGGSVEQFHVRGDGFVSANGTIRTHSATAIPAGGSTGAGFIFSTTAFFGVFFGSGAPSLSAAQGSLYLRSDGTTTNDRAYINTNGTTGWTALTTAA